LPDESYATKEEAIAAAEAFCPYPLRWICGATDRHGNDHLWGAHPEVVAFELKGWRHSLEKDGKDEFDALLAQLGSDAAYGKWYVDPLYRARTSRIPNAQFPHDGARYFAAPCRYNETRWSVYEYLGPQYESPTVESLDTREAALVRAGELDYRDQRRMLELRPQPRGSFALRLVARVQVFFEELFDNRRG
jgi:hypothetical protein